MPRHLGLGRLLLALALAFPGTVLGQVAFSPYFRDGMVLQRQLPLRLWGTGTPGARIAVTLAKDAAAVRTGEAIVSAAGTWAVTLAGVDDAGPGYSASVSGDGTATVRDVLLGEVWMVTGQSNANMSLLDHDGDMTFLPGDAGIRHFDVAKLTATSPQDVVSGTWSVPSSATRGEITALGFHFARALREGLGDVPVGIVRASWGDTFIESWMTPASLSARADFRRRADTLESDAAERRRPSRPYHAMIHPLRRLSFRGWIWYQGENNTGYPLLYRDQLASLVESWRSTFAHSGGTFLVVQLTGIGRTSATGAPDAWPGLREAQAAIRRVPGTAVAVTIDVGTETTEIHPKNKVEIGRRVALLARRDVHGQAIVAEGPRLASHGPGPTPGTFRVGFATDGRALVSRDGLALRGFEVAGDDGVFRAATATIDGTSVILASPEVPVPVAARHAWSNVAPCNLASDTDPPLPAEPFRTPFARAAAATPGAVPPGRWMADVIGVTHSGAKYSVPTRAGGVDLLNEGADRVVELGARVLKLWLTDDPRRAYPNFDGRPAFAWPYAGNSVALPDLASLAAHPFYREALSRPELSTIFLVATGFAPVNWRDGISPAEEEATARELRDLALYLVDAHAGSGKTFILQNWEGDNLLDLARYPQDQWQGMTDGLVAWLKARQRGVAEARAARPGSDVSVWHCIEANYNPGAARPSDLDVPEEWTFINKVMRDGHLLHGLVADLYSWSSWSGKAPGEESRMSRGIDYLRARVPATGPLAPDHVLIGEYGAYENSFMPSGRRVHDATSGATHAAVVGNLLEHAWRSGARHAVYWSLYANGTREGVPFDAASPVPLAQQDLVGTWLIRPPGPPEHPLPTFTPAHGDLARLARLRLLDDRLESLGRVHARSAAWSISTAPASWAPAIRGRVYRTSNVAPEWISWRADAPIVDVNVTAFQYGGEVIATERVRASLSADGTTWGEPFALAEVDVGAADPATPLWKRLLLRLPRVPPESTRFLRIELVGDSANWGFQLGGVTLVTAPVPPPPPTVDAPRVAALAGSPVVLAATPPPGRQPTHYVWTRGDTAIAVTREPRLSLPAGMTATGTYSVRAADPSGLGEPAGVHVTIVGSWTGDDDGDGLPNLLAHALGAPARTGTGRWPPLEIRAPEGSPSLAFVYDPSAAARLSVESSPDLDSWVEIASRAPGETWTGIVAVAEEPLSSGLRRAIVEAGSSAAFRFHRLSASLVP